MSRWKKFRLWLSLRLRHLSSWVRPIITEDEVIEELVYWMEHDKRQREFTRMAIRNSTAGDSGDDGKLLSDILKEYDPKKENLFGSDDKPKTVNL